MMAAMPSSHFQDGHPSMVDVSAKDSTAREAFASATVVLPPAAVDALRADNPKGDPIVVAELAGIMAAKRTSELIPLCHPLPLASVQVRAVQEADRITFEARCKTTAQTGVEMEALTAASVAALTLYDMLKYASKGIVVTDVMVLEKRGGRSGTWVRE